MPKTTCIEQQGDNKLDGEYFSVQWDDGVTSESKAEDFLEVLEYSYEKEVDELGWQTPTKMSQYLMLALIQSGGSGAYTTAFTSGSCSSMPYIVAGSSSFSSGNWYRSMAAHEFNHASRLCLRVLLVGSDGYVHRRRRLSGRQLVERLHRRV
jgi:hypothetical protein